MKPRVVTLTQDTSCVFNFSVVSLWTMIIDVRSQVVWLLIYGVYTGHKETRSFVSLCVVFSDHGSVAVLSFPLKDRVPSAKYPTCERQFLLSGEESYTVIESSISDNVYQVNRGHVRYTSPSSRLSVDL